MPRSQRAGHAHEWRLPHLPSDRCAKALQGKEMRISETQIWVEHAPSPGGSRSWTKGETTIIEDLLGYSKSQSVCIGGLYLDWSLGRFKTLQEAKQEAWLR